jgi:hypothetical protein
MSWICADICIGDLKGNKQADDVKEGLGGIGNLKKNF